MQNTYDDGPAMGQAVLRDGQADLAHRVRILEDAVRNMAEVIRHLQNRISEVSANAGYR